MGAVKNALQRDGLEPSILDLDPERSVNSQLKDKKKENVDEDPPLKDDPTYRCECFLFYAYIIIPIICSNTILISQQILQNVKNGKNLIFVHTKIYIPFTHMSSITVGVADGSC